MKWLCIIFFTTMLVFLTGCGKKLGYVVNKGKNQVIWRTWDAGHGTREKVLQGADATTFERLKFKPNERFHNNSFGKDKKQVYWQGYIIKSADPHSFEEFGKGYFRYRDANSVFIFDAMEGMVRLKGSDAKTFQVIDDVWARDAKQAYWFSHGFIPHDISSFEASDAKWSFWARDKKACYWGYREVKGVDRKTFKVMNVKNHYFARDHKHLFWLGWVIEGVNPDTFVVETSSSGHDGKFRYQFKANYKENNVDAATCKIFVTKTPISK